MVNYWNSLSSKSNNENVLQWAIQNATCRPCLCNESMIIFDISEPTKYTTHTGDKSNIQWIWPLPIILVGFEQLAMSLDPFNVKWKEKFVWPIVMRIGLVIHFRSIFHGVTFRFIGKMLMLMLLLMLLVLLLTFLFIRNVDQVWQWDSSADSIQVWVTQRTLNHTGWGARL